MADYEELKKSLLSSKNLYEDDGFPASEKSLPKFMGELKPADVEWKRPKEICEGGKPVFLRKDSQFYDLDQGDVMDSWFIPLVTCFSVANKEQFEQVVPPDQSFEKEYTGLFRFRLWQDGEFKDVLIDDRLPTVEGKLLFSRNRECPQEFWVALLEKAYAKLYGGYEMIAAVEPNEVMIDLTGGCAEFIQLEWARNDGLVVFEMLTKLMKMNSTLSCLTQVNPEVKEDVLENGLVAGHGYCITDVCQVGEHKLMKLRHPWGDKNKWNGDWSEKSDKWSKLGKDDKAKLCSQKLQSGEFWMNFEAWLENFMCLVVCHLPTKSSNKSEWHQVVYTGEWKLGTSAGGPMEEDTFWLNPQFYLQVAPTDENKNNQDLIPAVVSIYQMGIERREIKEVSYDIFRLKTDKLLPRGGRYDKEQLEHVISLPSYVRERQCSGRHILPLGTFVIIPSTEFTGEEGKFLLRVFTEIPAIGI